MTTLFLFTLQTRISRSLHWAWIYRRNCAHRFSLVLLLALPYSLVPGLRAHHPPTFPPPLQPPFLPQPFKNVPRNARLLDKAKAFMHCGVMVAKCCVLIVVCCVVISKQRHSPLSHPAVRRQSNDDARGLLLLLEDLRRPPLSTSKARAMCLSSPPPTHITSFSTPDRSRCLRPVV
jgi:hypothetical protein